MKKSTKLLSVILAIVMIFSCMSVMASAYGDYKNVGEEFYDTNDNPRTFLYTDEQRASIVMDLLDGILGDLNLVNGKYVGITINLTSYDGIVTTFGQSLVRTVISNAGQLSDLNYDRLKNGKSRSAGGDVAALETLLGTVADNGQLVYRILNDGKIDLGSLIGGFLPDMTAVNNILNDLPSFLGGTVYDLTARKLPIGDDPALPNATRWADLTAKPSLDNMLKNIIMSLLTEPNKQVRITDPSQNTLGAQAIAEVSEDKDADGNPLTYYYCYGVDADGNLITKGEEKDKVYLTRWNLDSALVKGDSATKLAELIDFTGKNLYELLEAALPWAYDTYGAPNLDAQLRATLMQFCGAFNAAEKDEAIQAQLKAKVETYQNIQDTQGAKALSDAFKNTVGDAGNYNFMYLSLGTAQSINSKPDNLYYVVQWGDGWEFYHVDFSNVNEFFTVGDWEYQISDWASLTTDYTPGTSMLAHLNDIVGRILVQAVPSVADFWTYGGNTNVTANATALMKMFIKLDPQKIFGNSFVLPANFDAMDLEDIAVMIAKVVMGNLMPSLVLPEDVASLEEVLVYGVREYCAEILPEYGAQWDEQIAAANTEDAYLDIALNMGASIGMYYLRNLVGVGTFSGRVEVPPMGPDYTWRQILDYAIDWVLATWVPGLASNIVAKNPTAFNGDDPIEKLAAVFSYLAPSTVKLIGCNSTNYALDGDILYSKLRAILNGDFTGVLTALERKSEGTVGNKSVCSALVTLVEELFGGLGFETAGNWNALKTNLDTAAAAAEPIQALVGAYGYRTQLASLARDLVACVGQTRSIWAQDGIKIITSFVGGFTNALADSGMTYEGDSAFAGQTSYTVNYTLGMNATGVRTAFNNGAYKTGTTSFDDTYHIEVVRTEIRDANGVVKSTTQQSATFAANESVALTTTIPEGAVPVQPSVYTVATFYKMQLPSGEYVDNGAELRFDQNIIVTSLVNDNLVPKTTTFTDSYSKSQKFAGGTAVYSLNVAVDYSVKNTYISERQELKSAEDVILTLTNRSVESVTKCDSRHTRASMFIEGYGWNRTDENGKINSWDAESGGNLTNLDGKVDVWLNGNKISAQDAWFMWNINSSAVQTPGAAKGNGSNSAPLWVVEDGTYRTDFTEDFNTYKITTTPKLQLNYNSLSASLGNVVLQQNTKELTYDIPIDSYIILYNSYNLENILNGVLAKGISADSYDMTKDGASAAWAEYTDALAQATLQLYGEWDAPNFANNHKTKAEFTYKDGDKTVTLPVGTSTFKVAGIRLNNAVDALSAFVKTDAGNTAVIAPSDPTSELYPVYTALKAETDKGLNNQNYTLYRWYKYYDVRTEISNLINAATPPTGVANNKLAGVGLDNEGIGAVVNTVADAKIKPLVEAMVEAPTNDEIAAAAKAAEDYKAPSYNITSVMAKVGEMQTNYTRLLPKYAAPQTYYLADAIAKQGNVAAAGYTAESYAAYAAALATAQTVVADANASQSKIHQARYDLLRTYRNLVKADEATDFTQLQAVADQANMVLANQVLYAATEASGLTTQEALVALLAEVGYKTTYDEETYYIGGGDTAAAWLDGIGLTTALNCQGSVDRIVKEIQEALANLECTVKVIPDDSVADNTTAVDPSNLIVDGFKPGTINTMEELLALIKTTAPEGFTADLKVTASADIGFGTGTKVVLTLEGVDGFAVNHTVMVYGDVNGDGAIDAFDAALINMSVSGKTALAGDFATAGDTTDDGVITAADYNAVAQVAVGNGAIAQTR